MAISAPPQASISKGTPLPTPGPAFNGQQPGGPAVNGSGGVTVNNTPSTYVGKDGVTYNNATNQPVTMSANVSTPISNGTTPPPAVINSSKATGYLNNVGTQIENLNNDASTQSTANSQPANTQGQTNGQTDTSGTSPDASKTPATDPAAQLNDQINSILANLGQGESALSDEQNNATTANNEGQQVSFSDAENENQMQQVQQYQQYAGMLNSIQSGTYPLSAPEQQLLSSTQSSFAQAIAAQQTANQAYTGQITEAMASLGINTTAPTQAMGNIFSSIATGQSKIADLNTKMATSVSNLQLAFQKQDFDQVQTEWDNMSKQFSDRQTALTTMQKSVADSIQQQRTDMQDFAKTAISAVQSVSTMNYNEKQDAVKNLLAQQTFTETERKNLVDEQQNQEKINLQQQAQGAADGTGNNLPTVSMTASNMPSKADQAAFLAQFSPTMQTMIKGIASYNTNPASFSTSVKQAQGGLTRSQIIALAQQYDPTYNEAQYATRQALIKNFTSGTYSQNINSLNTVVGHITDLQQVSQQLGNGSFTPFNSIRQNVASLFGSGTPGAATLNINAATGELASVFKKSGATDTEIGNLGTLSNTSSPDAINQYIEKATQLMGSRLQALSDTYTAGMGKAPDQSFLSPTSQQQLLSLQKSGLNIQVPQLANSPISQVQTFHDASAANATLLDNLMQANPGMQPQDVVDLLQQQGILSQ